MEQLYQLNSITETTTHDSLPLLNLIFVFSNQAIPSSVRLSQRWKLPEW